MYIGIGLIRKVRDLRGEEGNDGGRGGGEGEESLHGGGKVGSRGWGAEGGLSLSPLGCVEKIWRCEGERERDAGPTTSPSPGPRHTHRQMLPHNPRPLLRKARYEAQPSTPTTCGDCVR